MSSKFQVYKASAGSGKTFTLAALFIGFLLKSSDQSPRAKLRSLMAITFTKKAAREMKDRVLNFLEILSEGGDPETLQALLELIEKETALSHDVIRTRSREMQQIIIENYQDLSIGTIDSFSHSIVRSFSKELDVDVAFEVSLDTQEWLSMAIDRIFNRFDVETDSEELTRSLIYFFLTQLDKKGSNWNLKPIIESFARHVFNDELFDLIELDSEFLSADYPRIINRLKTPITKYKNELKAGGQAALDLISKAGLSADDFTQKNKGVYGFFYKASQGEKIFDPPGSHVLKVLDTQQWTPKKASANAEEKLPAIEEELYDLLVNLIQLKKQNKRLHGHEIILKQLHFMSIISFLYEELSLLKKENNILLIDDFNRMINRIVRDDPVPFIYEKIGHRYRHYLIDEFQDTSVKQFHNIVPLIDNALSSGHGSVLVGDSKQAIYRFRAGEVELFNQLPAIYSTTNNQYQYYENQLKSHFNLKTLKYNYRSKSELVDFNNRFYHQLAETLGEHKSIYDQHEQQSVRKSGGYVKIEVLDYQMVKEDGAYLKKTLETINKCCDAGYQLSDIAILTRNSRELKSIAEHLNANKIAIESNETLSLSNHRGIQALIAFMRYLSDPDEDQNRYRMSAVLQHYFLGSNTPFYGSFKKKKHGFDQWLKDLNLSTRIKHMAYLPLVKIAFEIEHLLNLNLRHSAYFLTLIDFISDFVNKAGNNLSGFIEKYDDSDPKVGALSQSQAVKLLTIHKAKGLEFPVVILPFLDWDMKLTRDYHWIETPEEINRELPYTLVKLTQEIGATNYSGTLIKEKEKSLLDDLNVLYVATTRPTERLYMFTTDHQNRRYLSSVIVPALTAFNSKTPGCIEIGKPLPKRSDSYQKINDSLTLLPTKDIGKRHEARLNFSFDLEVDMSINSAQELGRKIHWILSKIKVPKDLEPALQSAINQGFYADADAHSLHVSIKHLWENETIASWFSEDQLVFCERDFVAEDGSILRPDRVVVQAQQTVIIDYKTGILNDIEITKYKKQVLRYMHELEKMKYPRCIGYLLAVPEGRVIQV